MSKTVAELLQERSRKEEELKKAQEELSRQIQERAENEILPSLVEHAQEIQKGIETLQAHGIDLDFQSIFNPLSDFTFKVKGIRGRAPNGAPVWIQTQDGMTQDAMVETVLKKAGPNGFTIKRIVSEIEKSGLAQVNPDRTRDDAEKSVRQVATRGNKLQNDVRRVGVGIYTHKNCLVEKNKTAKKTAKK